MNNVRIFTFYLLFLSLVVGFFLVIIQNDNDSNTIHVALLDSGISDEMIRALPPNITVKKYNEKDNEIIHADLVLQRIIQDISKEVNIVIHDVVVSNTESIKKYQLEEALKVAKDIGPHVLNLSLGLNQSNEKINILINDLIENGTVIVAAAGNRRSLNAQFPARYDNVISVGMLESNGEISKISARKKVDFFADGEIDGLKGTSFSTPLVTNIIIKMLYLKELENTMDIIDELRNYLESTESSIKDVREIRI